MQRDCLFCQIVKGEMEAEVVYEDDHVMAFLDINPVAPGHTMIIPKSHGASIMDLDNDDVAAVFIAAKTVMKQIDEALDPAGFNYGVNHGEAAGQAIGHLHLHILPRFENDGGGSMHTIVRNPPREQSIEEIAGLIREAGEFVRPEEVPDLDPTVERQLDEAAEAESRSREPEKVSEGAGEEAEARDREPVDAEEPGEGGRVAEPEPQPPATRTEVEQELERLTDELKEQKKKLKEMKRP